MTLYNHFPGKDDLISAVLDRRYQDIVASLRASVKPAASAKEQLRAIFALHEAWFATPEFSGCLFECALAEFGTEYPKISTIAIQYKTNNDIMDGRHTEDRFAGRPCGTDCFDPDNSA